MNDISINTVGPVERMTIFSIQRTNCVEKLNARSSSNKQIDSVMATTIGPKMREKTIIATKKKATNQMIDLYSILIRNIHYTIAFFMDAASDETDKRNDELNSVKKITWSIPAASTTITAR